MFVPLSKKPTAVAFSVQWSFRLFCKMNVFEPSTVRTNTNLPKSSAIDQSPAPRGFLFSLSYLGFFFLIVMFGLFFTTVTLGLDPGVSSLSSSGAFFFIVILGRFLFIVILGRNTSRGSPLQIPVSSTGMTNKELSLPILFSFCYCRACFSCCHCRT